MPLTPRDGWRLSPAGHIHRGYTYNVSQRIAALASGATLKFALRVTDTRNTHLDFYSLASTGGPCRVRFYEAATISDAGTLITAYNKNRLSANTNATCTARHSVTASNDGTMIEETLLTADKKGGSVNFAQTGEWTLKDDTDYIIAVTNNNNSNIDVFFNAAWYEDD